MNFFGLGLHIVPIGILVLIVFFVVMAKKSNHPGQHQLSGLVHTGKSALVLILVVGASLFLGSMLPGRLGLLFMCIPMVVFPAWYARRERTAYLLQLGAFDNLFPGESRNRANAHMAARQKQAQAAARDTSPFITLGTALGTLTKELDGYAPDAGLPVGMTVNDLSQHLLIIGETGTRKTSLMRKIIAQYVASGAGSMLVLDGKGKLAAELAGLPNYTVIDPSIDLGLIEGLGPEDVARALSSVGAHFGKEKTNPFFISEASTMIFHGGVLLQALVAAGVQDYVWNLHCYINLLTNLNADPTKEGERLAELLANFIPKDEGDVFLLANATTYAVSTIVSYSSETRSNIWATVTSWFSPLLQHKDLVRWSHITHGFDISTIDSGGLFGVSLPEVKFGKAGLLAQSLIKERVFNILRRRVIDPKPDQKKILILMDEAQELIGDADKAFLPIARELGGMAIYASQSIDAFYARIGDQNAAKAFLNTFVSQIILKSSEASLEWITTRLGNTKRPSWKGRGAAIGFVKSLDSLATTATSSLTHEGTTLYRKLRRQGAGQFEYGGVFEGGAVLGRQFGHINHLHIPAMTTVEFEAKPLITLDEADSHLAEPSIAIVQVQRGGVRRRDFVELSTLKAFPPTKAA